MRGQDNLRDILSSIFFSTNPPSPVIPIRKSNLLITQQRFLITFDETCSFSCLSPLELLWQNTTDWVAHEQQQSLTVLETGRPRLRCRQTVVWWGPASWSTDGRLHALSPHMLEGARELSGACFKRALIPHIGVPPSWLNHQSPHLLIPSHWE